jgi:hypothetical protein
MERPCATVVLRDGAFRPAVKDLLSSRPDAHWVVDVVKTPITPAYQSLKRVRRGVTIVSTKHQEYIEATIDRMSSSMSTGFAANQEAFAASRQLAIDNHNQLMQSLHDPSVDPREPPAEEMSPLESWHNSYSLAKCIILYMTSNDIIHLCGVD